VVGFKGKLVFDPTKPTAPAKLLDVSRLHGLGWKAKVGLREGIERTYRWYVTV
jgi:GDP-L-fucose synthase